MRSQYRMNAHVVQILIALLSLTLSVARAAAAEPRMNVLLIVADDLRTELGCYGVNAIKTPNIDRLAARGVRFDRAYVQYPVCNPSRVSFLTGLRPDTTGVLGNNVNFRSKLPDVVTLPQLFRQNGYFTASLGKVFHRGLNMEETRAEMDDPKSWDVARYFQSTKLGLSGEGRNLTGGKLAWCRWLAAEGGDEDQPDGQIARDAIKLLEEHRDGPFFIAVGFHKPHDPFIAPRKYFEMYPEDNIELAKATSPLDPPLAIAAEWKKVFEQWSDVERREMKRSYYAGVSFMDAQVGKVIEALDRLKLADNTIVVFIGDHGYHLGERGWWNKNTLFELSCRAPMIVVAPKVTPAEFAKPVELVDIYPTLTDLCAIKPPHELQGSSLRPLLTDASAKWDKPARTQVQRGKSAGRTVRTQRWRYTEWDDGQAGAELYDHSNDEPELHNLAGDEKFKDVVAELKALVK
jgi:uncharacterized sulfatase